MMLCFIGGEGESSVVQLCGYPPPLPNVKYPPSHLLLAWGKTESRSDPALPLLPWKQGAGVLNRHFTPGWKPHRLECSGKK